MICNAYDLRPNLDTVSLVLLDSCYLSSESSIIKVDWYCFGGFQSKFSGLFTAKTAKTKLVIGAN